MPQIWFFNSNSALLERWFMHVEQVQSESTPEAEPEPVPEEKPEAEAEQVVWASNSCIYYL